jgi:hypothetical protein
MSTTPDFATVVLPAVTQFELPRPLARKLLDLGMVLLEHDKATSKFKAGQKAKAIVLAMLDNDDAAATTWLDELVRQYNEYVEGAIGGGGATTFFIP